ncbi:hypothetical protein STAFG_5617 [Streptomyces afghaniensis 772]|uniref:Blue (type 1) copper domain-containing protein n=2 Tax=Streptomyces afghaniensis TaxID=66865 RepID=S4NG31_9ACTN|nr:hypothetical protein STAFG_5617 [Streptomyces afghaniensis 772]
MSAVLTLLALPLLPAGQASAASYSVTMKGYAFSPASLSVPAGSTVTWTNQDTAPHDVKTTSGPVPIHSPMLDKGQSWSLTFTTAGSYGYVCTVHPNMTPGSRSARRPRRRRGTDGARAPHRLLLGTPGDRAEPDHAEQQAADDAHAVLVAVLRHVRRPGGRGPVTAGVPAVPGRTGRAAAADARQAPHLPPRPAARADRHRAGVAVLCLLLVGSRALAPQAPRGTPRGGSLGQPFARYRRIFARAPHTCIEHQRPRPAGLRS